MLDKCIVIILVALISVESGNFPGVVSNKQKL